MGEPEEVDESTYTIALAVVYPDSSGARAKLLIA